MTLATSAGAAINVERLETESGFTLIGQQDVQLIEGYDKILHIVDPEEIKNRIQNKEEENISKLNKDRQDFK